jgi:hypothetical protein
LPQRSPAVVCLPRPVGKPSESPATPDITYIRRRASIHANLPAAVLRADPGIRKSAPSSAERFAFAQHLKGLSHATLSGLLALGVAYPARILLAVSEGQSLKGSVRGRIPS